MSQCYDAGELGERWCDTLVKQALADLPSQAVGRIDWMIEVICRLDPSEMPWRMVFALNGVEDLSVAPMSRLDWIVQASGVAPDARLRVMDAVIDRGADPSASGAGGSTALHAAVSADATFALERLVRAGCPIDALLGGAGGGMTALALACRIGNSVAAEILLELGADVHGCREVGGRAPIHWAASQNPQSVAALIAAGADIHEETELATGTMSPINKALETCSMESAGLLFDAGARPDAFAPARALSCKYDDWAPEVLEFLANRCGVDIVGYSGLEPVRRHPNLSHSGDGEPAVHLAARSGHVNALADVLARGADVDLETTAR